MTKPLPAGYCTSNCVAISPRGLEVQWYIQYLPLLHPLTMPHSRFRPLTTTSNFHFKILITSNNVRI